MSTRIVERHGIRRLIPKCRQYFRPIVPLQYDWHNRKKGSVMNQTDKVLYTAAVHTTGGREGPRLRRHCRKTSLAKPRALAAWCNGVASLPLGAPVELEVIFELAG